MNSLDFKTIYTQNTNILKIGSDSYIKLFATNCIIYTEIENMDDIYNLQVDLDKITS